MQIHFHSDLKSWMERKRWTPKHLAEHLGIRRQSVHNWIEGKSAPKNQSIIYKLYDLGGDELITFRNISDKPKNKTMSYFEIEGGHKLEGEIHIPGAKNAALPMLCASLLTPEKCVFTNVPNIVDIRMLCDIFSAMGADVSHDLEAKTVEIQAKNIDPEKLKTCPQVKKFRASILMLGPLLARFGHCTLMKPGGCVIGARPNTIHTEGLAVLGADVVETDEKIEGKFNRKTFLNKRILLPEASVTGTENLSMFASGVSDTVEIYFTAAEPHVCGVLNMLRQMGADIEGIATHHLRIHGTDKLKGGTFEIPSDGLLVGTYAIATTLTGGNLKIKNVNHKELFSFYGTFKRVGGNFEMEEDILIVKPSARLEAIPKVHTAIFPGFPTDLQSPFGVLLTQCEGESLVFETLFENRLSYLHELERMGAKIRILNAHQARILGPTKLKGAEVQSWDLRAGAAVVLAGLIAQGKTRVTNINYIDRGYENFEQNLQNLGAHITRVESVKLS